MFQVIYGLGCLFETSRMRQMRASKAWVMFSNLPLFWICSGTSKGPA